MGRVLGPENKPHDERTVIKHIQQRTEVKEVKYDCCSRSCMSYSMYPDDTECRICHHPGWKTITTLRSKKPTERRVAYVQHNYIPLTHRIRLWWSNPAYAKKMITYRNTAMHGTCTEGKSVDFWTGQLVQDLGKRDQDRGASVPMFLQDTDIAFFFSTDGVKVFKSRRAFHIWPLFLINLNLPPAERVKRCNMILVGFVPGPKEPTDLDAFLFPLVQEMKLLEKGFPNGFNAARRDTLKETFVSQAYIVCVGADMIGRAKVGNPYIFQVECANVNVTADEYAGQPILSILRILSCKRHMEWSYLLSIQSSCRCTPRGKGQRREWIPMAYVVSQQSSSANGFNLPCHCQAYLQRQVYQLSQDIWDPRASNSFGAELNRFSTKLSYRPDAFDLRKCYSSSLSTFPWSLLPKQCQNIQTCHRGRHWQRNPTVEYPGNSSRS
jgi:hypothetical protein